MTSSKPFSNNNESETFHIPNSLCYGIPIVSLAVALVYIFYPSTSETALIHLIRPIGFLLSGIGLLFGLVVIALGKPDQRRTI